MNRWGIMVDVSHPSKGAIMQAIALSKAPVIASHSAARALANHSRNMDDEQLQALKKNGGVMQTVAFASYVKVEVRPPSAQQAIAALRQEFGLTRRRPRPAAGRRRRWRRRRGGGAAARRRGSGGGGGGRGAGGAPPCPVEDRDDARQRRPRRPAAAAAAAVARRRRRQRRALAALSPERARSTTSGWPTIDAK